MDIVFDCDMRKIVIHSPHAEFRALIRGLLTNVEALFVPSASRKELLRICQTTKCDLVLTDDVRLFMNGSDAIRQIRQGSALPQIFVLSHDISEDTITALLEEGVNQFGLWSNHRHCSGTAYKHCSYHHKKIKANLFHSY